AARDRRVDPEQWRIRWVIDLDAAVRGPNHATQILPSFDSGDHLRVNNAGNIAQCNAIPLSLLEAKRTRTKKMMCEIMRIKLITFLTLLCFQGVSVLGQDKASVPKFDSMRPATIQDGWRTDVAENVGLSA